MLRFWSEKRQAIFAAVSFLISLVGMMWVGIELPSRRPPLLQPPFWVAAALWTSLGVTPARMLLYRVLKIDKRLDGLMLGLFMLGTVGASALVPPLRPISGCFIFYFLGWWWYGAIVSRTRPRRSRASSPLTMLSPTYLPDGFKETQQNEYRVDDHTVAEITFGSDDSEYLICLTGSTGDIPDRVPVKGAERLQKSIKEVLVSIEREVRKPSRIRRREQPPFIQANWSYRGINFNLRTDGLPLQEVEKVIASMLR